MTPEAAGTVIAALIASLTGVGAFVANRRAVRVGQALEATDRRADVEAAEVVGWKTLIDTLMGQYKDAASEVASLQARLRDGNLRFEMLSRELRDAHIQIARQDERIGVLRDEVRRLGGDVERINRVGKQGPPGDQGPPGEPG